MIAYSSKTARTMIDEPGQDTETEELPQGVARSSQSVCRPLRPSWIQMGDALTAH